MNRTDRLCTICARKGSKGLPNKNIRSLLGKPLITHTIEQALKTELFESICVSSDSEEILSIAESSGANFCILRDDHLASDTSGKMDAIVDAVQKAERHFSKTFRICVDLDVTAPLRLPQDIKKAVEIVETKGRSSVFSGTQARHSPYFNMVKLLEDGSVAIFQELQQKILRRQDSPKVFDMNASIYCWQRDRLIQEKKLFFSDTRLLVMPRMRSIDIDDALDFVLVEHILKNDLHMDGESYEALA
ncbi:MAG: acylneuraminate cytidylyltransferase family protein [Bdellovibrionota bacterium]